MSKFKLIIKYILKLWGYKLSEFEGDDLYKMHSELFVYIHKLFNNNYINKCDFDRLQVNLYYLSVVLYRCSIGNYITYWDSFVLSCWLKTIYKNVYSSILSASVNRDKFSDMLHLVASVNRRLLALQGYVKFPNQKRKQYIEKNSLEYKIKEKLE